MTDNTIQDRYILGPAIGRGGMAEVRRARDTRLERDVAIKRLKPDLAGDPIFQERFRREAHSAAGLNHPNIVSVYDTGEAWDDTHQVMIPYIVMELVVGHTLREILHDGRKIQPTKALELTQCVLDALDYSHRHGIVHRDIKPANVMLTNTGQVKVMDFGIARAVSDTAASMTQTASVIGTPQYLSPEQVRGETVDRRSDLYSTGVLLYELLTGKPPFEGDSPVSLAYQHVRATPVPPSEVDHMITPQMDKVTLKALAKNVTDRYQTAHEMYEDIDRLLAGQKVQAQIPPSVEDTPTQVVTYGTPTQVMTTSPSSGPPDDEEEPPNKLGRIIAIGLGAVLVVALAALALVLALNGGGKNGPVDPSASAIPVPMVIGLQKDVAIERLESHGLEAEEVHVFGADDNTVGTVIEQNPPAESGVPPGSVVRITINDGSEKIAIPEVIGKDVEEARKILGEQGFTSVEVRPAEDEGPEAKLNSVLSIDPATGGMVTKDQLITLYIATGNIKMPQVAGQDAKSAKELLTGPQYRFKTVNIEYVPITEGTENTVMHTLPQAGDPIARDTPITLYVTKKQTATTPSTDPTGGEDGGG
ncbi:MAG: Stk1 family PASTA domain-containing Ser/Thr kinase [Propionibacteriaceae bacterium]|nr:Stk1 family PASTA domain-containing Ser/Thr kinase [Propionibacteriaceae bacterium]